MLTRMLRTDFSRKKWITIALFSFVLLSAFLVSSGSNMVMELVNSMNYLFVKADAPHFVQMHAGEINQPVIDRWAARNSLVTRQQTMEMVNIDGSNIRLGNSSITQQESVMDNGFVKQNEQFDFLLDLDNQLIQVAEGEIAVPIYYMQKSGLRIGDTVVIADQAFEKQFTVVDFVRDVQMNPSVISSKRFVVHDADFETLKKNVGETEYLIEFQLTDRAKLGEFSSAYQSSGLPKQGPAIDINLLRTMNALTDGIVAALLILISVLINVVALLCLRFTILASIEEDYREIGVMKAIGIQQRDIKRIYLAKYVVMAGLAGVVGYLLSLFLNRLFVGNIMLYFGSAPKSLLQNAVPIIAVTLIFLLVVSFCMVVLRRFNKITAVEALRSGSVGEAPRNRNFLSVNTTKVFDVNIFLGLRDVYQRFKLFRLLFFIFFVCAFIIIVPLNLLNTIQSPGFATYMGVGRADIRIDMRQSDDVAQRFDDMIAYVKNDPDVVRFSPLVTSQYGVINADGVEESINVETGDFSIFPLEYSKGAAPTGDSEIALSWLNSNELKRSVGDTLRLVVNGQVQEMVVSGIYQDVTNGGHTAKAPALPLDPETVVWYVLNVDVKAGLNEKMDEYSRAFYPAKVTDLDDYMAQTLGTTIDQITLITIVAIMLAVFVSLLITSLFMRMLIAKDYSQIAIMKSIGASLHDVRVQYVTRALLVLNIGIILGAIVSNTFGQYLVSALMSNMGANAIEFVINPLQAYILAPLTLMVVVTITTLTTTVSIKETSIARMILE
jgi:putative ABC transport system permease protein